MQEYNWFTGNKIRVGIYGESHSPSIGVCLEGLDYDKLDTTALAAFMKRRAPGQNAWSTPRKEEDAVVVDLLQKGLFKAHIDLAYFADTPNTSQSPASDVKRPPF